jgi:hypothetical protein
MVWTGGTAGRIGRTRKAGVSGMAGRNIIHQGRIDIRIHQVVWCGVGDGIVEEFWRTHLC